MSGRARIRDADPADASSELGPTPAGFGWDDYLAALVAQVGSLTAVAERLAERRRFADDVGSIERALRRLRAQGQKPAGKWGKELLATFGLPATVEARLRWMAFYHSRFTDLPVPVCEELVRAWEHPPTTERREGRLLLALARISIALRRNDHAEANSMLDRHAEELERAPADVRVEALLVRAYLASKGAPTEVASLLARVEPLLDQVDDHEHQACFRARWIDQRAYEANRGRDVAPDFSFAEALHRTLPDRDAPPFVLCRRANGLAYALHRQGRGAEAAALAREAVRHAGDGGHVRLRVMALAMLARVDPSAEDARARALSMSRRLEDETLLLRLHAGEVSRARS